MKRFLFLSIFFHAAVLLLLFSWEIPQANRLLPRSVVEVTLIERIEGKPEGKKEGGDNKAKPPPLKREKVQEKKDERTIFQAPRRIAQAAEEKKTEEPKQEKVEPDQKEMKEEKPSAERTLDSHTVEARTEEIPGVQAKPTPPAVGGGEWRERMISPKGVPYAGRRGDGGTAFLPLAALEPGTEGIPMGVGGKGTDAGRREAGPSRFSSVPKSSGDGDSVIGEIMRRIEKAKRYPRMARKMGTEGQATLRFRIEPNGKVERVELLESSGSEILDQASLETVQRAAPFPYKDGWLKVVIVFKML